MQFLRKLKQDSDDDAAKLNAGAKFANGVAEDAERTRPNDGTKLVDGVTADSDGAKSDELDDRGELVDRENMSSAARRTLQGVRKMQLSEHLVTATHKESIPCAAALVVVVLKPERAKPNN